MDCLWIKRGNSLVPADPVTEDLLAQVGQGQSVTTDAPRRRRNPAFHKLMMAMLHITVDHTRPRFADVGDLMDWLKLKSGMVDEIDMKDGRIRLKFQSVSFASMDETRFRHVSEQWRAIICAELMPGTDPELLLNEAAAAA